MLQTTKSVYFETSQSKHRQVFRGICLPLVLHVQTLNYTVKFHLRNCIIVLCYKLFGKLCLTLKEAIFR